MSRSGCCRGLLALPVGCCCVAAWRSPTPKTSSPRAIRRTRKSTRAGRRAPAPKNRPELRGRNLLDRHPGPVLRTGGRRTRTAASPSSSSATARRPGRTPVDELKTVRVDLPVGLSVNPGATVAANSPSSKPGRSCPTGSKVGESYVTAAVPWARRPGRPARPRSPSTTSNRNRARRRASGSNSPATKSSSKATSTGPATTTRASRSTSRPPSRKRWAPGCWGPERRDPEKPPGLQRPLRRRDLPHHADHLLRTRLRRRLGAGRAAGGLRAHLLDLSARRLLRKNPTRTSPTAPLPRVADPAAGAKPSAPGT